MESTRTRDGKKKIIGKMKEIYITQDYIKEAIDSVHTQFPSVHSGFPKFKHCNVKNLNINISVPERNTLLK